MICLAVGRSASHVEWKCQFRSERHGVHFWEASDSDEENHECRLAWSDGRQPMLDTQCLRLWHQHYRRLVAIIRRLILDDV